MHFSHFLFESERLQYVRVLLVDQSEVYLFILTLQLTVFGVEVGSYSAYIVEFYLQLYELLSSGRVRLLSFALLLLMMLALLSHHW